MLEAYYHDRGFLTAACPPRIEAPPGAQLSTLFLDVTPGPRVAIGARGRARARRTAAAPAVAQRLGLDAGSAVRRRRAEGADRVVRRRACGRGATSRRRWRSSRGIPATATASTSTVRMNRGPHVTRGLRRRCAAGVPQGRAGRHPREGTIDEDMLENEQQSLENELRAEGYPRRGGSLRPRGARPGRGRRLSSRSTGARSTTWPGST